MQFSNSSKTVLKLGAAQTLVWAYSYYLPSILAAHIAPELGTNVATAFTAFSVGSLVSAFTGSRAGRAIDTLGDLPVLVASNSVFAMAGGHRA